MAKAAIDEGHKVTTFLASDAVQLMRDGVLDNLVGLGTGNLRELYNTVVASGSKNYMSGMSTKARRVDVHAIEGKPAEMAMPNVLVKLALEHDRMFTY